MEQMVTTSLKFILKIGNNIYLLIIKIPILKILPEVFLKDQYLDQYYKIF